MKKILKYILLIVTLFILTMTSITYVYKDKIIQHFIDQMNSQVNTPITVQQIDISVLDQIPYISVILRDVRMQESYKGSKETLIKAKQIVCALNPFDILTGDYSIHAMDLKDAYIHLEIDQYNTPNYLVLKKQDHATSEGTVLDLKAITLKNTTIDYQNDYNNKHVSLETSTMEASLQAYGKVYHVKSRGDIQVINILVNEHSYLEGIPLIVNADLLYNQHQRTLDISPSTIIYRNSLFSILGKYGFEDNRLTLSLASEETNFITISDLIPSRYLEKLKPYQYTGEASFQLSLDGILKKQTLPPLQLVFSLKNTTVIDSKHHAQLENMNLKGYYQNGSKDSLALTGIAGDLNQKSFNSDLSISNFKDPKFDLAFTGAVTGATLQEWAKVPLIDSVHGEINIDFTLAGKTSDFKSIKAISRVSVSGDISIADLNISFQDKSYPLQQLKGNCIFNNNDLAISSLSGLIGENDFELTGLVKNFLAFSMIENQPLGIEADFSAQYINLDQLLVGREFESNIDQSYHFAISPQLYLKLNCAIDHLQFRRFDGRQIRGDLDVKHQVASSKSIKMNTMGGDIVLSGNVDAKSDSVLITFSTHLNKIHIDSLFYVFENFNQDFLIHDHLKGIVNAHIDNQMSFDHFLHLNLSSIRADINTTIIGGELNNFEPMQKLSRYLDGDKLDNLKFAELANNIHVENQKVYLPQMQVNSNVSNITIGGTHTFDQRINYSVVAPFNNKTKVDKDATFGSIETSQTGQAKVFLKITGTTSNYDISYDKSALKKEIISDLKREVQQLKEAFRKKGKKKKERG